MTIFKSPEYASVHGALQVGPGRVQAVHQCVACLPYFLPYHTSSASYVKHLAKSVFRRCLENLRETIPPEPVNRGLQIQQGLGYRQIVTNNIEMKLCTVKGSQFFVA